MKVSVSDEFNLEVESSDLNLLEAIKNATDGWKVRNRSRIILPVKAGPKILNFDQYGIEYGPGAQEAIESVIFNFRKRVENVVKIKSQYGKEIKFDYDFKGKYPPLEHQKIMYNMIAYNSAAAILAEPGTCKTGAYLWAIDRRIQKKQVKKCLVITLSSLKKNVLSEMAMQTPHLKGIVLQTKAHADKVLNKEFKDERKNIDYDIYISNYESMNGLCDLFDWRMFDMVVLDEAHRIGSYRSQQTKAIVSKFENTLYKYIVTGTLNANNSLSFFMPYRYLGADCVPDASFYEFRKKHCFTVDPDGHIWKEMSGTKEIVKKCINAIGVYFSKEECLDLPDVTYSTYECEMEGEQRRVYDEMKKTLIAEIFDMCDKCNKKGDCDNLCDQKITAKSALTAISKLQQMACGFYMNTVVTIADDRSETVTQNIIEFKENPKLALLMQTINNIPADRKIIVWSNFVHSIDIIKREIERAGFAKCLTIYKDDDAFEQVEKFKLPEYRILVANPSKAGAGLNIQFSSYQIFYSCNYSYIQREQAEGRQIRQGQKSEVTVIDLCCSSSIDETVLKTLKAKGDLSDELVSLANMRKILT